MTSAGHGITIRNAGLKGGAIAVLENANLSNFGVVGTKRLGL
jgi:hypothetical protein